MKDEIILNKDVGSKSEVLTDEHNYISMGNGPGSKLKIAGISASGGLGVLLAALLVSEILGLGVTGILSVALLIYLTESQVL